MTSVPDLRARLDGLTLADRNAFRRRLEGAAKAKPHRRSEIIAAIAADLGAAEERMARRRAALPRRLAYPEDLPITEHREELLTTIRDNQVVVVAGETGSGKSTQLPKLCLELGRGVDGWIGHTQPRRIAARSLAERVAEETGTQLGGLVGYTVRFTDQVGDATLVKLMTDGILLNEIHRDRRLLRYDTIILDEAHERSLNIDFLIGYLHSLLPRRPDLKVIITSATIDTARFATHFHDAPVVEVSGRTYPVEVRYRPLDDPALTEPRDQAQGIADAVAELTREGQGDVLVFCSGERDIRDAAEAIADLDLRHTEILPLYGRMSMADQHRIFRPHTGRRIVVSTNVAETSLTVPGIRYVVDPGTARISRYGRRSKVQRLPIEPVSRASADQRAGRCGRIGPGICIRLYSEDDYASRPEFTEPEILRTNLASVILQMAALGLGDVESFPFLDPPDTRAIRDGIALLEELGAIEDGEGLRLTGIGRRLSRLPVDPRIGRMILEADRLGCVREVLVIAAGLSIQDPRLRPEGEEEKADQLHRRFVEPGSDLLTWLRLWEHLRREQRGRTSSGFRRMCRDEYLEYRRVREWQDVHSQLREITHDLDIFANREPADADAVHRALLAGLISQIGVKDPDGWEYRGTRSTRFAIFPGSSLFKTSPEWVMAAELVETSRLWARQVARIRPEWVEEAASHLIRRAYSDPWWDVERGSALAYETVTLYGLPLVSGRAVQYGRIDPPAARELFIRHALVSGEWETHHRFDEHNRKMIAEVVEMEDRARRTDLLVTDDDLVAFFDERIPADVVSVAHFDRWWKDARRRGPQLLDLSLDDLLARRAPEAGAFPEVWRHGALELPLLYEFDPSSPHDGMTVVVPTWGLDRIDPSTFAWLVPGMREELFGALLRSLPKQIRTELSPLADYARALAEELEPDGDLVEALHREVARRSGVVIPAGSLEPGSLPRHLRPHYRLVDEEGTVVAETDDLETFTRQAPPPSPSTRHSLEQSGLTGWAIDDLPRKVEIGDPPTPVYPALADEGEAVAVRLFPTRDAQSEAMWTGTRRLLALQLTSPGRILRPLLGDQARRWLGAGPYRDTAAWAEDCQDAALDTIIREAGGPAWDATGFERLLRTARNDVSDLLVEIGRASLSIHETLASVWSRIDRLEAAGFTDVVADVTEQLSRLVYPGFAGAVGIQRLHDIRRYVEAVARRLERLPEDPHRDRRLMEQARAIEAEVDRVRESLPGSPEVVEAAWMCQELRVSLFAQGLGTKGKVSEPRIRRLLEEAVGG